MEQQNKEETNNKIANEYPNPVFYKKELIFEGLIILVLSLATALFSLLYSSSPNIKEIAKIKIDMNLLPYLIIYALADGVLLTLQGIFIPFIGKEKPILNKARIWIQYSILFILGIAAYLVISIGLSSFSCPLFASTLLASLIFSIYLYLMIKLYFYDYVKDKRIFYEIVRFALVGVIAALFDLSICYLFQFVILPQTWASIWLTIVSVTMGFIIGVIVNYVCSVYMVFKATTKNDKSKTPFGRFLFVFLAFIGLLMGYGLQYFFYDFLHVGYVLTFIIRTLIVLVWNYFSRKYFIFK